MITLIIYIVSTNKRCDPHLHSKSRQILQTVALKAEDERQRERDIKMISSRLKLKS